MIKGGGCNKSNLFDHFNSTAKTIKKLRKIIESQSSLPTENQKEGKKDDKLIPRIEKIKQNRQKRIKNDKKWREMDDENDELISRLNRLKPAGTEFQNNLMENFINNSCHFAKYERKKWQIRLEPVESDLDIEFMQKEEQIERQKDEFF